jgi:hypothetical protein
MKNRTTIRMSLLASGLWLVLLAPGASSGTDLGVESNGAPPARNEPVPKPGEGFVWPPGYWSDANTAAPPAVPQTPYEPAEST